MKRLQLVIILIVSFALVSIAPASPNLFQAKYGEVVLKVTYNSTIELDASVRAMLAVAKAFEGKKQPRIITVNFYNTIQVEDFSAFGLCYSYGYKREISIQSYGAFSEEEAMTKVYKIRGKDILYFYESIVIHEFTHAFSAGLVSGRAKQEYISYYLRLTSLDEPIRKKLIFNIMGQKEEDIPAETYTDGAFLNKEFYRNNTDRFMVLSYMFGKLAETRTKPPTKE